MEYEFFSTIGQDSHRFSEEVFDGDTNRIMLGGISIPHDRKFLANSDGDVVLHAITNAISGATGINVLGGVADRICLQEGIKDSSVYIKEAMKDLGSNEIIHVSMTIECLRPKLKSFIPAMKENIGKLLGLDSSRIGITATTGEGLTEFGKGEGLQVFVIMSFKREVA